MHFSDRQKVVVPRSEHDLSLKLLRLRQPRGARAPVDRWEGWHARYTTRPTRSAYTIPRPPPPNPTPIYKWDGRPRMYLFYIYTYRAPVEVQLE